MNKDIVQKSSESSLRGARTHLAGKVDKLPTGGAK